MTKSTELTLPQRAAVALCSAEHEAKLKELAAKNADIVEIKNGAGRDQCHAAMMVLANARVTITKSGKEAREDATKFSKAVIEEEKRLIAIIEPEEARLRGLRDDWDQAREREKEAKAAAERNRIAALQERIAEIRGAVAAASTCGPALVLGHIGDIERMVIDASFEEFQGQAQFAKDETLDKLRQIHAQAAEREAEAARLAAEREELARLRAEEAERQAAAAVQRAEEERQARAAREAEEKRLADERAAQEAALLAQREAQERALAAEREEQQAAARRLADERTAFDRQQAAAAAEVARAAELAEKQRKERESAANQAARLDPMPTGGEWTVGKTGGAIVTTAPIPGVVGGGFDDVEYYGGYLLAESISRPADALLMAAAPALLAACTAALRECPDLNCAAQLRAAIEEAGAIEFMEVAQAA
jgi:hypothetical protein